MISIHSAGHYKWGAECDGWHLVKTPELSVIEERMPSGTSEARHYHVRARQFFYVLEGQLTMEVDGETFLVKTGQGIEIHPGQPHQAINQSAEPVRFLVTSHPPSHNDRINV